MERNVARQRRRAVGVLFCVALAAFAFGATLGAGRGGSPTEPRLASTLAPQLLAGERIVVGLNGTSIGPGLRSAIRRGRVAGVVLFAGNLPSRAAGAQLVARLQAIPRPPK